MLDVETTGFSPSAERLVEVGVVLLDPRGDEIGAFSTLLDPGRDPGPTHVHGISAAMLEDAPSFDTIHPHLVGLLSGRVLVGHNVERFDLPFLRAECRRLGGEAALPASVVLIDTLTMAQVHLGLGGRARLVDCCDRYGLRWEAHHRALGDARATAALFCAMRIELGDEVIGTVGLLRQAAGSRWPSAGTTTPRLPRWSATVPAG